MRRRNLVVPLLTLMAYAAPAWASDEKSVQAKPAISPVAASKALTAPQPGVIDRVKSVPRKALLKRHRLELTPFAGVTLNDPYYVHLSLSGSAVFYPHDAFGIGVGIDYFYAQPKTTNIDAVRQGLTAVVATFDQPVLFGHVDMYWLPIYGKVSLFNNWICNFDFYASAGLGAVTAFGSRTPLEANIAIGQHYALEQWLALRFEVRDHMFLDEQQVASPVSAGQAITQSSLQNYVMFLVGVSFFIPPSFEYSFQ